MRHCKRSGLVALLFLAVHGTAAGEEPSTRAAQIQAERLAKTDTLKPHRLGKLHDLISRVRDNAWLRKFRAENPAGFRPLLGGLGPGSGFAFGLEYIRPDSLWQDALLRTSLAGSNRDFYKANLQLRVNDDPKGRVLTDFAATQQFAPSIDYFGPGPRSVVSDRTAYSLETSEIATTAGLRFFNNLAVGTEAAYALYNVSAGRNDSLQSTEELFEPQTIPGLEAQSNFLRSSAFIEYDTNVSGSPWEHSTRFLAEYSYFADLKRDLFSFQRFELEARQRLALFHGERLLLFRGRMVTSNARRGDAVPFFLQPQLGGADNLRGFESRRFYGNNLVAINAEYRWAIFAQLDMAVFADAGKVSQSWSSLTAGGVEKSAGFGFRIHSDGQLFVRTDAAFSREGLQIWVTFQDLF